MIKENGQTVNVADRVDAVAITTLKDTNFLVTTAGVEAKVGADPLFRRHTLAVINNSSAIVAVAFGTNEPYQDDVFLLSGQAFQVSLAADFTTPIFLRTEEYDVEVTIIEISSQLP
jgi:hypothetical protein